MVVNIDKETRTFRIIDRAMGAYWTSPPIQAFKQATGWALDVLPCTQHNIHEQECGIAMLRDMEVYFCMKGNHRIQNMYYLLNDNFDIASTKLPLRIFFEAVREQCDNYLDYIVTVGSMFML